MSNLAHKLKAVLFYAKTALKVHGIGKIGRMAMRIIEAHGVIGGLVYLKNKASYMMPIVSSHHGAAEEKKVFPHYLPVDVIVCVHNALEDVQRCLSSVVRHSLPPYRIIIVDDGSDVPTRDYLKRFAETQGAELVRHEEAKGYTLAANAGLRASDAEWSILLNSDTIVTPYWLERMVACGQSHGQIGLVGPLSNTASWQSVPQVMDGDDWAENPLPEGISVAEWGQVIAGGSARAYPRVGFLNGFCLMIKKAVREDLGLFDEETFAAGYGEENDYCLRAGKKGWELAVADDTYIYHAQSKSYSHERRQKLCERADKALREKHSEAAILSALEITKSSEVLEGARARISYYLERERLQADVRRRYEGKRVLFILPVADPGGGAKVVFQEAYALRNMGVNVEVVNFKHHQESFEKSYKGYQIPVHFIDSPTLLAQVASEADAVIATLFSSVFWICDYLLPHAPHVKVGYYVQDYEPYFFPEDSDEYKEAKDSYTALDNMQIVTKSQWNKQELAEKEQVNAHVIGPSYDWYHYYPVRMRPPGAGIVRICAMIRPSTPRRAPELTMRVLARLKKTFGDRVVITIFGADENDPFFKEKAESFSYINAGVVASKDMPALLNSNDIFLDLSTYQAMGLTALEAMACRLAVVVPEEGGAKEFVLQEDTGLLVDSADENACYEAAARLVEDNELRERVASAGLMKAAGFYPEKPACHMLEALFGEEV